MSMPSTRQIGFLAQPVCMPQHVYVFLGGVRIERVSRIADATQKMGVQGCRGGGGL